MLIFVRDNSHTLFPMQLNVRWQGRLYHSAENCIVTTTDAGTEVNAVITGMFAEKKIRVEYVLRTNRNWEVVYCEIKSQIENSMNHFSCTSQSKGYWTVNGKRSEAFDGCIDIDISLTPFTNTLPINRLKLSEHESHLVDVLYFDVLEGQVIPVQQRYTRLSETEYRFEKVPNDFEAVISVDELGLVINYPGLFYRTAT